MSRERFELIRWRELAHELATMKRLAVFATFAITAAAFGGLLNWAEGRGFDLPNQITWGLALFTGLVLGSIAERHWFHATTHRTHDRT